MKQSRLLDIVFGFVLALGPAVPTASQDLHQYIDLSSDAFTKSDMTRAEIEASIADAGASVVDIL
jgi:hypothetical protein